MNLVALSFLYNFCVHKSLSPVQMFGDFSRRKTLDFTAPRTFGMCFQQLTAPSHPAYRRRGSTTPAHAGSVLACLNSLPHLEAAVAFTPPRDVAHRSRPLATASLPPP